MIPPRSAQPRGRPGRISNEQVIGATLILLRDHGVASFTMAKLARSMGIGVMSLYHYFPSKTELLDAASDRIYTGFALPEADLDWESSLREWVLAVHEFFSRNPVALDLINRDAHISPAWLRVSLPMLRSLSRAGFTDRTLAFASRWLVSVVMGSVATQRASGRSGGPTLPIPESLSESDKSLIGAINRHSYRTTEIGLTAFVTDTIIEGLRTLRAAD